MRVNQLSYSNFKGHSGKFDLAAVNVIAGANFVHKTTIPLAIRLALAGYLPPPIGTKGIYDLAGNPENAGSMSIQLLLDSGRDVIWNWIKDAKGSVKSSGAATPDIKMPELMLEPGLFFAKTAAEQIQTIFSVCDVDDFSPNLIKTRFGEVMVPPLTVCEETIQEVSKRMDAVPHMATGAAVWMAGLLDWLKVQTKTANDEYKLASGAFQAFRVDAASGIPVDVSGPLAAARGKLTELQKGTVDTAFGLRARRSELVAQLARMKPAEDYAEIVAKGSNLLKEDPYPDGCEDAEEYFEGLIVREGSNRKKFERAKTKAQELTQHISNLEKTEACPFCLNAKKGWKKAAEEALRAQLAEAITERDGAKLAMDEAAAGVVKLKDYKALGETVAEAKANQELRSNLQAELDKLVIEIESRSQVAVGIPEQIAAVQVEISALEEQQGAFNVYMKDRDRRATLEQQVTRYQARVEIFKAITKIVQEEQAKLIDKAFGQVLNVARHFTDGLLNSPLEFVNGELGRRVSESDRKMGIIAPVGSWIPFKSFSGTENLLALAGFGVALTDGAPVRLVVLDELGRLDDRRKLDVTMRMLSLCESGVIDQAILIDVNPKPFKGLQGRPGFQLIEL